MKWIDIRGSIAGSTVYSGGALAARNATATLPSITPVTAEIKAGGTIEAPITGQVEAMELAITLQGPDEGMRRLCKMGSHDIEIRWVQDVMGVDGSVKQEGCKAFFRGYPKEIGGLSVEVGSAAENEFTFGVTRYQLYVGGVEYWCIDQLNGIFRVDGTDYAKTMAALL